jgi:cell wall-associated NlpC family hydrolase
MNLRIPQKHSLSTLFITAALSVAIALGCGPRVIIASHLLPNVSPEMEHPEFWTKKIPNPNRLLLTLEQIQEMNTENLKKDELLLCRVRDLKEEWTREEILNLLKEDWEGFGRTREVRYGRYGVPLGDSFWNGLTRNWNQESIRERNPILFALTVRRTDIRVFPTDEVSMATPDGYEFDRFQHSSISPGSLVGIYHFSRDRQWAYVQTGFIRGWVRSNAVAIAKERTEAIDYDQAKDRLVITGNFVNVFGDPSLQQPVFTSQMGSSFPLISLPENSGGTGQRTIIQIPFRETDGGLSFRKGYLSKGEDVHRGFLPYTQKNAARQAFKMLHQSYGWGEMFGARDCSRFIMDLFATFGILMPRNSKLQSKVGIALGEVEGKLLKEKAMILDRATPLATTLRLPGHIMLYLGKEKGRYFAIHSLWGIQRGRWFGLTLEKVGRVVVSDLSLGRSGPKHSLFDRITDIQFIGSGDEVQKKPQ